MQTWERIRNDPSLTDKYLLKEKVIDQIRKFFKDRHFHEVFTPILVPTPSCEPNLEVFKTELRTYSGQTKDAYLIMSPEFSIKKLLSAGIGNCFEIARCFRNEEEVSRFHNPEFTMLEWYRTNASYKDVMNDFEQLFTETVLTLDRNKDLHKWTYQDQIYDISLPWPRYSISEVFEKFSKIGTDTLLSEKGLLEEAKKREYIVTNDTTWEEVFYQIIFNEIEPELQKDKRPYFLYDYPVSQASLSRKKVSDPRFAERFEVFLAGIELGNCFSELLDANEQNSRFEEDLNERKRKNKSEFPIDKELIKALSYPIPDTAGIAVGIDRFIMLIGNFSGVSETMFFPAKELFDLKDS